jgi:hypothetical protein
MNTTPKRGAKAPAAAPKSSGKPAAVKPAKAALLPEPLPTPERIERENDLA